VIFIKNLTYYPSLGIEITIGTVKPDVVELDENGTPLFWGEGGKVGVKKCAPSWSAVGKPISLLQNGMPTWHRQKKFKPKQPLATRERRL